VEKLVPGGYGLARTAEGAVLVRGGLPGEEVEGRPARRKGALFLEAVSYTHLTLPTTPYV